MNKTMTFSQWYEFNCLSTKHPIFQTGISVEAKIFSRYSYKKEDMIFSGIVTLENLNLLFGSYNVFNIRPSNCVDGEYNYSTLEVLLFPPQAEENSNV